MQQDVLSPNWLSQKQRVAAAISPLPAERIMEIQLRRKQDKVRRMETKLRLAQEVYERYEQQTQNTAYYDDSSSSSTAATMKTTNGRTTIEMNHDHEVKEGILKLHEGKIKIKLRLKTKLIKAIQRIQTDISNGPAIEEYIVEQLDDLENENERSGDIGGRNTEDDQDTDDDCSDATDENPYHGIRLEKEININRVLTRTEQGKQIMECLKQGIRPNEKLMNQIKHVLCEYCLNYVFFSRPSAFQKNLIALSLVETYPILRSSNNDVPQALWFHQHARGLHRHSGRLHYHLEYLIRKSANQVFLKITKLRN
ncbi:uncharacterized protein LOC134204375 [Armigeres subalbatus]|uniref:uncharacterized protein LOC134204375 n=1 Tax=Armigeres subalbatus TaxID=124917 RepID=UPI002ED07F62